MRKYILFLIDEFKFLDQINSFWGIIATIVSSFIGDSSNLFAIFLLFNVADLITGWLKSRINHQENSHKGLLGVLKKLGYWIMILIAFVASSLFIQIGETLGFDLKITTLLGWFVLASLAINELRSILENLVEAGYYVPSILTKGLEVANNMLNKQE